MFAWIHLYILQSKSISQFEMKSDPLDILGFIVTFAIIIGLIVFMNISKRIKSSVVFKGKGVELKTGTKLSVDSNFYNKIKYFGLTKKEASVLEKILKSDGGDPCRNLLDSASVDENFKLAYKRILRENSDKDTIPDLLEMFSIRNAVELFLSDSEKEAGKKQVRNFRRKNTNIACNINLVGTENVNGKKKLVLKQGGGGAYTGYIQNISQGGCAVVAINALAINNLVKIDFSIGKQANAALGQIIRINKETNRSVYHIKFLKLSKQTIIDLNAFIFGYN